MARRNRILCTLAVGLTGAMLLTASCRDRQGFLPKSSGRPYEVLIVGDRNNTVGTFLSSDVEGLPQSEPAFDVSHVDSANFNAPLHMARNIVMVSIDPELYTATRIRYEKNAFARPQMTAYIGTPSEKALKADMPRLAPQLIKLLNRSEINATIAHLAGHRNTNAEKTIKAIFGVGMQIPMDMVINKRTKDFLWLSNNAPEGMQNLVIYRSAPSETPHEFALVRDSVMKQHIKGETDAMFMKTVASTITGKKTKERGREITVFRGLWEMEGDNMGGPFVSHTVGNITAETFVFAPKSKKRNKIRQTEAVLYTLK